ncbi:hypothetical protein EVAR_54941_1 [Eumeta japonica]|uniref:Uncharacterized protein n=1 Tax=Eumeta variegata TaxID=151549 RepID=A0A4C1YPA3_EUMVA|nr:hypothetical protein EVAR_54941_1 [Eumeta japonica]
MEQPSGMRRELIKLRAASGAGITRDIGKRTRRYGKTVLIHFLFYRTTVGRNKTNDSIEACARDLVINIAEREWAWVDHFTGKGKTLNKEISEMGSLWEYNKQLLVSFELD